MILDRPDMIDAGSAISRPWVSRKDAVALGLKRYFTGRPCAAGHVDERFTVNSLCNTCRKERASARYHANLEKSRSYSRAAAKKWYEQNKEQDHARSKAWRAENPERVKANNEAYSRAHQEETSLRNRAAYLRDRLDRLDYRRLHYIKNREDIIAREKARYAARPDHFRQLGRLRRQERPERARANDARKRAARLAAPGHHTADDIRHIRQGQRDKCAYCPKKLNTVRWHIDHIQPLSRGGSNYRRNLQILCQPCNQAKYAKDPIDFARSLGRLL